MSCQHGWAGKHLTDLVPQTTNKYGERVFAAPCESAMAPGELPMSDAQTPR